jgi:hypothetical protein
MMRVVGTITAAMFASQVAATNVLAVPATEPRHEAPPVHTTPPGNSVEPTGPKVSLGTGVSLRAGVSFRTGRGHHVSHKVAVAADAEPSVTAANTAAVDPALPALPPDQLTTQEQDIGKLAVQNGDEKFLMVDKSLGKILLWEAGKPVFVGNALTGASFSDRLPAYEMKQAFAKLDALDTKVTPAGRFTVARGFEKGYGPLLDIREIKGKDWAIAIHKVFLGFPWEHRADRLQSSRYDDKNITFGCINVTPETMELLLRELPEKGATPLYVLPRDETKTAAFFAPPSS